MLGKTEDKRRSGQQKMRRLDSITDSIDKTLSKINNFKTYVETKNIPETKKFLRKNTGRIRLPDFRLCYKAIVIKAVWYWYKIRHLISGTERESRNKPMYLWSINLQ